MKNEDDLVEVAKELGIPVVSMPPMPRAPFPDDETYRAAMESSIEHSQKRVDVGQDDIEIDIGGLDKCKVLFALFENASPVGMGFLHADKPVVLETVREYVAEHQKKYGRFPYVDYFSGRPLKVDLNGDSFESDLYDRDWGQGAAGRVVEAVRQDSAES